MIHNRYTRRQSRFFDNDLEYHSIEEIERKKSSLQFVPVDLVVFALESVILVEVFSAKDFVDVRMISNVSSLMSCHVGDF